MDHHGDHDKDDLPHDNAEARDKGEEARKDMDKVPEHGTDPLHEGP